MIWKTYKHQIPTLLWGRYLPVYHQLSLEANIWRLNNLTTITNLRCTDKVQIKHLSASKDVSTKSLELKATFQLSQSIIEKGTEKQAIIQIIIIKTKIRILFKGKSWHRYTKTDSFAHRPLPTLKYPDGRRIKQI